jgi:hypothetical protein
MVNANVWKKHNDTIFNPEDGDINSSKHWHLPMSPHGAETQMYISSLAAKKTLNLERPDNRDLWYGMVPEGKRRRLLVQEGWVNAVKRQRRESGNNRRFHTQSFKSVRRANGGLQTYST